LHTHSSAEDAPGALVEFRTHGWHTLEVTPPRVVEYVPPAHASHTDASEAPLAVENVPAAHATQASDALADGEDE